MTSIKLRLFTFEDNLHHAKPSNERTLLQNLVCYCISKNVVIELWIFMWKAKPGEKHLSLSSCPHCTCCKAPVKQFLAPIRSPFFQYCSPNVFQPSTRPGSSFTARERHSSASALKSGATFRHLPFCSRNSALCLNWPVGKWEAQRYSRCE